MKLILAVFAVLVAYTVAYPNVFEFEIDEVEDIVNSMETKEELFEFISGGTPNQDKSTKLTSFTFKDCGGPNAMASISSVVVSPDPLKFPGPLNVAAKFQINNAISRPLQGDVVIEKKVFDKYIKLPCVDNIGSCTYDGLCDLLEQVQCPDPLVKIGIDCRCPFKVNSYNLPKIGFNVDVAFLPAGDYHIVGNATSNGAIGACLDLILTLA